MEGVVVGTAEAAGSLIHGSTQIVVTSPAKPVPGTTVYAPASVVVPCAPAVIPTTTIVTTHSDGTVTTVTRQASAYELGPVVLTPIEKDRRMMGRIYSKTQFKSSLNLVFKSTPG